MTAEIVIVTRSLPHHQTGGMEIATWDLARALAGLGLPVRIVTTSIPGRAPQFTEDGIRIVALAGTPPARYSRTWRRALRLYFGRNCLDSTYAVFSVSAGAFGLLSFKRTRPGITFVMQAHGTSWGEFISKWRSPSTRSLAGSIKNLANIPNDVIAYRKFDALIAVGPRVYRDLIRPPLGWLTKHSYIQQINNGVDTSVFRPDIADREATRRELDIPDQGEVIVSACRLHSQKGVDRVLDAFARVQAQRPNAVCVIAGDGPELANLTARADRLNIRARTIFTGDLGREALARLYRAADVFVFLSHRVEVGLALNVLKALASGLPCVVSRHLKLADIQGLSTSPTDDLSGTASLIAGLLTDSNGLSGSLLPENYTLAASAQAYRAVLTADSIEIASES